MEYLIIILSFIAIIAGTVGDTYEKVDDASDRKSRSGTNKVNPQKKKRIRITWIGWAIVICGLLTSSYTFIDTFKKDKELDWQKEQKENLKKIGYSELRNALNTLIRPLYLLYSYEGDKYPVNHNFHNDSTNSVIAVFQDSSFLKYLDSIGINSPVNLEDPIDSIEYSGKSWKELLISHSTSAKEMLNEVWAKYNLYFDLETVAHISELLNDEFYNERLLSLRKVLDNDIKISEFVNQHSDPPKTTIDSNFSVSYVLLEPYKKDGVKQYSYGKQYLNFIQKCKQLYKKMNVDTLQKHNQ